MIILELTPAARTNQLPIPPFPADPKTKALARFIDLMPVNPVPRPLQDFREIVVCHLDSLAKMPDLGKARQINAFTDSCGEPFKEDRLQSLATLAHGIWVRGDAVPSELIEQLRMHVDNIDAASLGRRAEKVAALLTCVSPDLATLLLQKAIKCTPENEVERAYAQLTASVASSLRDERRIDQVIDTATIGRQDPRARALLLGIRVLTGRLSPVDVCKRVEEIERIDSQLAVLRYWCVLNARVKGADSVARYAINLALSTSTATLDAGLLADLSRTLIGVEATAQRRELINLFDGLRGTAKRLGPSVDFARLQLFLGAAEYDLSSTLAHIRLRDLLAYIEEISDLPSRGEAYAHFLSTLGALRKTSSASELIELVQICTAAVEHVVLVLCQSTADHYTSLGGIITGLAAGDATKALELASLANTEARRNAILEDVISVLSVRSLEEIDLVSISKVLSAIPPGQVRDRCIFQVIDRFTDESAVAPDQIEHLCSLFELAPTISDSVLSCRCLVGALKILNADDDIRYTSQRESARSNLKKRWENIDVSWVKVETGFGISTDLAKANLNEAKEFYGAAESLKSSSGFSASGTVKSYLLCVRLVIRLFCGLLKRHVETESDLSALAAVIDIVPSYGERAILWADVAIRAELAGRMDLTERIVRDFVAPAFSTISKVDKGYRTAVFIEVAPALYKAHSAVCTDLLNSLTADERDAAISRIVSFLLHRRAPSDPVDSSSPTDAETNYDTVLQITKLLEQVDADWLIYYTIEALAESICSKANRYTITLPQRADISRRLVELADLRLPAARHISHEGFKIVAIAQAYRIAQAEVSPQQWNALGAQTVALDNIADRVFVTQAVALCLPKKLERDRDRMIASACAQICEIPWAYDQIERHLLLAERLRNVDSRVGREQVNLAASVIASSTDDVSEQRRRLVDVAYRFDEELAKSLVQSFDDDHAKRRALSQLRLLEVRGAIAGLEQAQKQDGLLARVRGEDVAGLGLILTKALNSGRIQNFKPNEIRRYLELAADAPLDRAYFMFVWYLENAIRRFSGTAESNTVLRSMFTAVLVGTELAGQIAGKSLVRLKALKTASNEISANTSLMVTPGSREEAIGAVGAWLSENVASEILIHDPFFGPEDLMWLQQIRVSLPTCRILVLTSKKHNEKAANGKSLDTVYAEEWRRSFDQLPPKAEIAIIGDIDKGESPIHDRWLISGSIGLRFGTSLNSLGLTKDAEISEMTIDEAVQKRVQIDLYLSGEQTEHKGIRLRLFRFWL